MPVPLRTRTAITPAPANLVRVNSPARRIKVQATADRVDKVAYQHQAEQQKINLKVEVQPGLPEISIDPERMEQVLGNLISNALRYTPEGGEICLTAKQVNGQIVLAVQDNGSGILSDILPHIFERSYRGDPSRSGNESGLGLAIAKAIVELHGGRINADSAGVGQGSIFSVFIPVDS